MRRTRGEANQSLYRARIILSAWQSAREDERQPDAQITGAFLPAVKLHMHEAYGWFLLAVSGVEQTTANRPPSSTADLTPPEAGRSRAPELLEFERLEQTGWLADLLSEHSPDGSAGPASSNLLGSDKSPPGYPIAQTWVDALENTMSRMDDSLAEC